MGSVAELGFKNIRGMFYEELEGARVAGWIDRITNLFTSDQPSEDYKWLSQAPVMRQWIGGRNSKAFTTNGISIENLPFEASIRIHDRDMRRDKTDQLKMRVGDLVTRSQTHWASLLTALLVAGTATPGYDGQYYFSASHAEGSSGTYSNLLTNSDYATLNVTTPAKPTPVEFAAALMDVVTHFYSYKDDQGEPRNEDAMQFMVMVPANMQGAAITAISKELLNAGTGTIQNALKNDAFTLTPVVNVRLTATDAIYVFRSDARAKPLIRQQEKAVELDYDGPGGSNFFETKEHRFGIDTDRNVGYGMHWQAIKATFS